MNHNGTHMQASETKKKNRARQPESRRRSCLRRVCRWLGPALDPASISAFAMPRWDSGKLPAKIFEYAG